MLSGIQTTDRWHPAFSTFPLCNTKLLSLLGQVKIVPALVGYTKTGVLLEGGRSLDVDMILYATGYSVKHDFIEHPEIKGKYRYG